MLKTEYEYKKAHKHYQGEQVFVYSESDYEELLRARSANIEDLPAMAANNRIWRNADKQASFLKGAVAMFIAVQVFEYFFGL